MDPLDNDGAVRFLGLAVHGKVGDGLVRVAPRVGVGAVGADAFEEELRGIKAGRGRNDLAPHLVEDSVHRLVGLGEDLHRHRLEIALERGLANHVVVGIGRVGRGIVHGSGLGPLEYDLDVVVDRGAGNDVLARYGRRGLVGGRTAVRLHEDGGVVVERAGAPVERGDKVRHEADRRDGRGDVGFLSLENVRGRVGRSRDRDSGGRVRYGDVVDTEEVLDVGLGTDLPYPDETGAVDIGVDLVIPVIPGSHAQADVGQDGPAVLLVSRHLDLERVSARAATGTCLGVEGESTHTADKSRGVDPGVRGKIGGEEGREPCGVRAAPGRETEVTRDGLADDRIVGDPVLVARQCPCRRSRPRLEILLEIVGQGGRRQDKHEQQDPGSGQGERFH